MRLIVTNGVHDMRELAFDRVTKNIENRIRDLVDASRQNTRKRLARLLRKHRRDYANALRVQEETQNAEVNAILDEFLRRGDVVEFRTYLADLVVEEERTRASTSASAAPASLEELGGKMEVDE